MWGIAEEPFWPGAKLFLDLAHLGARQVPELDREFLEARSDQREARHQRGVAVALHDLGGHRLEADAEPVADGSFHVGREMREGADRAGELPDRGVGERAGEPLALALHLFVKDEQLEPEGGRLRMHPVGPADAGRVLELERAAPQHAAHARDARLQDLARIANLERERGVDRVVRSHPEVQPAALRAHRLRHLREEGDHVVAHLALDLGHPANVDARAGANRRCGSRRDHAARGELVAGGELDLEPALVAALVAPDRLHLRPRVALDHVGPRRRKT